MPNASVAPVIEKPPPGSSTVGTIGRAAITTWSDQQELLVKMPSPTPGAPARVQTSLATFPPARRARHPLTFRRLSPGYQTPGSFPWLDGMMWARPPA